ncbi:hypothetical protein [Flavobacterium chungbukense]|uniref:HNH nuclease domain-containing protein n=1 Tax=Flavobacterium chungbukense TaxID=877464 RepID=A0ABP7YVS8_9FLAO|nr:hypothetical protein [Flavobacterium chungbukense]MCC4923267.1 hypothetical protein [Flavobacterium chungbukense]
MVKIELKNSTQIINFHYNNLTIKNGKEWTIINHLNNRIKKSAGKPNQANLTQMFNYLITKVKKDINGFSILTASPLELEDFKNHFEQTYGPLLDTIYEVRTTPAGKDTLYRDDLLKVFYYKSYDKWKAYELAKEINVNVCPYCNRSYTFVLGDDLKKGTRFEFDHFFDKSTFPYLALSFYNLVPSCHICNSSFKGDKKFKLESSIHPYIESFGNDIVFSILPKNINFINGDSEDYKIRIIKSSRKIENLKFKRAYTNIRTFGLLKLYNMHKDYVNEIIQKSIVYNDDHIKELFSKYKGTLFRTEDDVRRMVLSNYISEEEYSKRPLSKLTADISKELGII